MNEKPNKRAAALAGLTEEPIELGDTENASYPEETHFRHWRWHFDDSEICWLLLDKQDSSTNTLSEEVMVELRDVLTEIEEYAPQALILRSSKKNGFIAGADIDDFDGVDSSTEIVESIEAGLSVFDSLENFSVPTVSMIHGFCLGGGLELALSCHYRVARDDAAFGYPEVLLGLHPGLGGTWRTLRHMPAAEAMTMMLTGRTMSAKKARRAGLVDAVVPERHMRAAALRLISVKPDNKNPGKLAKFQTLGPVRSVLAGQMKKKTAQKVRPEHYPAPFALIDLWKKHGNDHEAMRLEESKSFGRLIAGETAQNLVRVFHLRERLKERAKETQHNVSHVHVVGAGTMGGDIAAWCAANGFLVTLEDRSSKLIGPAIGRATELFKRKLKDESKIRSAHDRLIPDTEGYGLSKADLIIEAVPEDLDIKRSVYEHVESRIKDGAMLATNTSSIQLERLSALLKAPERFVGLHFFNPVARMPLVEVVTHGALDPNERNRAMAFALAIDKLPLPVRSAPGFLVNRALTPYLLEALACYDEGIAPEVIDAAAQAFGMPMGPIELADQIGLDVCLHVARVLSMESDLAFPDVPAWFTEKVAQGEIGKKAGRGLYEYKDGKPQKKKAKTGDIPADLADRLILPLLNSTIACLRENVVEDPDTADAGIIFGTGFAPFHGGPLHYCRTRGVDNVIQSLRRLRGKHGPRFTPDKGWPLMSTF